jgi:hypothetical protein
VTGGIACVQDALGELLGELVAADVEQDGDESRLLVLADLRRAPLANGSTAAATCGSFFTFA